jgi:DNA-binding NarL/FixJ family response regulator
LILVFGLHLDLAVAQEALRAGARGFIHAGMKPKQIVRAVTVALEGEIVAPRQLLGYLVSHGDVKTSASFPPASGKFWSSLVRALLMPK